MYTSLFATFRPSYWTHTIHMLHMHNCHFMFLGSYQISNIYKWLLVWPSYWAHINTYTRYTWLLLHGPVTELTSYAYHIQNFYHHAQLFGSHHTHTTYKHLLLTGTVTGLISYIIYIYILYIYIQRLLHGPASGLIFYLYHIYTMTAIGPSYIPNIYHIPTTQCFIFSWCGWIPITSDTIW